MMLITYCKWNLICGNKYLGTAVSGIAGVLETYVRDMLLAHGQFALGLMANLTQQPLLYNGLAFCSVLANSFPSDSPS